MANNKTRWNSRLMMLERALQCQARLQAYCSNWRPDKRSKSNGDDSGYDLREDILSPADWEGVREVVNVLKPLLYYTKLAEQRDTGLQDWVPIVDKIAVHVSGASKRFKERADEGPVYEWLHICCEKALSKLDRYFKLAHKSPVYYTAMVMDWTRVQAARAPDEDGLRSDPGRTRMLYIVNIFRFYITAL